MTILGTAWLRCPQVSEEHHDPAARNERVSWWEGSVDAVRMYLSGAAHLVDGGVIRYLRLIEMTGESGEHGDLGKAWPGLLGRCHRAMAIDWPHNARIDFGDMPDCPPVGGKHIPCLSGVSNLSRCPVLVSR